MLNRLCPSNEAGSSGSRPPSRKVRMPSRSQANSSTGPERAAAIESRTRMNGFSGRPAANAGESEPLRCPTGNLLEGPPGVWQDYPAGTGAGGFFAEAAGKAVARRARDRHGRTRGAVAEAAETSGGTVGDESLEALRAELGARAERLGDAAYDSLRAQLHRGGKPSRSDPDLVREKLLSRARNAIERASLLVAQAERTAGEGAEEE